VSSIHPENYAYLQQHVYRESGIVLDEDKHYLLEARLTPLLGERGVRTVDDLCALLRAAADPSLGLQIAEAMTTNETFFFREPAQYRALESKVIPELAAGLGGQRPLRFWSAASSTGQEAYSLAMMLAATGIPGSGAEILGTDLSRQVLERARSGRYSQLEVNRGLPVSLLVRHFYRDCLDWQLQDEIRRRVQFKSFDLRRSMDALGPFDVVFCRNVLIYFDAATKKRILNQLHSVLRPGGYLLLGGSESTLGLSSKFELEECGTTVFYRAS